MRLISVLVAFVATACTGPMPPPESSIGCVAPPSPSASDGGSLYLPTYCEMEFLPVAEVSGRLIADGGCLWLEAGGVRSLPLWPDGSHVERDGDSLAVVDDDGTHAIIGTEVRGGGGAYGSEALVEAIGEEVPAQCESADDEEYVLVYGMRSDGR